MIIKLIGVILSCLMLISMIAGSSFGTLAASIIYVPDNYTTIQAAVNAASPGDTIIVKDGTYTENIKINKEHLTIRSQNGAALTIVKAADANDHVFEVTAHYTVISGFRVEGANGKPSQYIQGVYLGTAGIFLKYANYCTISHNQLSEPSNKLSSNTDAIFLNHSSNSHIQDNSIDTTTTFGICWLSSGNNEIIRNNVKNCAYGIATAYTSENTISENTVENCSDGIDLQDISNSKISKNTSRGNRSDGLCLFSRCYNNIVTENSLVGNAIYGIDLSEAANNTITRNTVSGSRTGIRIYSSQSVASNNNVIYNNNFIDNTYHIDQYNNSTNNWKSPQPITYIYDKKAYGSFLGNYWSNYPGTDAGGDGIGDTPYNISTEKDNYPLVQPYEKYVEFLLGDVNNDGLVDAADLAQVEKIIIGLVSPAPGADVNLDGTINSLDITRLERIIAGY